MTEHVRYRVSTVDNNIFHNYGIEFSYKDAHKKIKRLLSNRIRNGTLTYDDRVAITISDASGYFNSYPSIDPNYFNKVLSISEYLTERRI